MGQVTCISFYVHIEEGLQSLTRYFKPHFSILERKDQKEQEAMVLTIPFLPRIDKISKLQHPKNGVRIKNKTTKMHMFPSPSNFMDEVNGFIWELTHFGKRRRGRWCARGWGGAIVGAPKGCD
jgi:hypothetical protein